MILQLQPLKILMERTLDHLQTKDTSDIFAEPVQPEDVSRVLSLRFPSIFSPRL